MFPHIDLTKLHGLSSALTPASSFRFPTSLHPSLVALGRSVGARQSPRA